MSVIVGQGGAGGGGTGAFTQAEKLALELEMSYKAAKATYFSELIYTGNDLMQINLWETPSKIIKLFQTDNTYTGAGANAKLTQQDILRITDNVTLRKVFGYTGSGANAILTSITRTII